MEVEQEITTLIIGAGPTGLGAATYLSEAGSEDWLIVDSERGPGGMAVTEIDEEGFHWDLGGHVIHSHYNRFDSVLHHHSSWTHPNRGGWVRIRGTWCPTPIQRNLGSLPEGLIIADELSSRDKARFSSTNNLEQYYEQTFGATLNKIFFAPFNSKQWGWDISQLSHTWTSLRSGSKLCNVPAAQGDSALTVKDVPEDTSVFPYPTLGTGSLWESVAGSLPVCRQMYNTTVTKIDLEEQIAHLSGGVKLRFRRCLSTIPLVSLIDLVQPGRPNLLRLKQELLFTSTFVVGLGFRGQLPGLLSGKTWIFSADPGTAFHRASIPVNFSPSLCGPGCWSIMFETSISEQRKLDPNALVAGHLAELRKWGINDEPISVWQKCLQYGYPLPFLGRDDVLEMILPEFERHNVLSRGRFGGWRYESSNQDYAFVQGVEAARFFHTGLRETVYWLDRKSHPKYTPL